MDTLSKKLLRMVCASTDGIQFFQIYRRMYLSPQEIAVSLKVLLKNGYVELSGSAVSATSKGYDQALKLAMEKSGVNARHWRSIPEEFIAHRVPKDQPYAPSFSEFIRQNNKHFVKGYEKVFEGPVNLDLE